MLYYEKIDINKGIDPNKKGNSKECMICHYWFLIMGSSFSILSAMVVII